MFLGKLFIQNKTFICAMNCLNPKPPDLSHGASMCILRETDSNIIIKNTRKSVWTILRDIVWLLGTDLCRDRS